MNQPDCPFCKRIAAGQYDYFDNYCVAFQPLNPVTPGHFLVVPIAHFSNVFASPVAAGHAIKYAGFLANQMGLPAANFITSAGKDATQTVFHLHVHVVPRHEGDGLLLPWSPQQAAASPEDMADAFTKWAESNVDLSRVTEGEVADLAKAFGAGAAFVRPSEEVRDAQARILRAFALATVDPDISAEAGHRIRVAFGRALKAELEASNG